MVETTSPGATGLGRSVGGRYRLLARLGEGGFGEVWRARDRSLDIDVAVKQVRLPLNAPQSQQAAQTERALREARHAAKLRDHPNVVAVHDVVDDGGPWIVMQLVEGRTLATRIKDGGPLSEPDAVYLAASLLQALRAAQAVKVVHRDIKPANVMLTEDGDVLLTDFGIAVNDADPSITTAGVILGSAEYMAPERARGHEATYASDLFSLGVTLYHAVEGVSPFHRDTPTGSLTAVLLEDPPEPQRAGALKPLLGALLHKDAANRPELSDALTMVQQAAEQLGDGATTTFGSTRAYTRPFMPFDDPAKNGGGAKEVAGLLAKALRKNAAAAVLHAENRIQSAQQNRRARAAQSAQTGQSNQSGQSTPSGASTFTGIATDKTKKQNKKQNKSQSQSQSQNPAKPRSPWQSKAILLLMLALLGLAAYALNHAEIPAAWHPVTADQDARVIVQDRIDPTKDAYSPGWWVIAPTVFVVVTAAVLWTIAAVKAIPDALGATVQVVAGIFVFAAGGAAAFCAEAAGAGIYKTWLPPIGALWASAGTLAGILTVAIGWAVEADAKRKAAQKTP
ncbi:serine/threonine protein kinase [Catenulispora sp. MAP12-49]|uniref:serine/threonine-protein kinase n=1 Tax=Catenulispora sp. MAP12-49 TaxID=3156302 RepID=UPI0035146576